MDLRGSVNQLQTGRSRTFPYRDEIDVEKRTIQVLVAQSETSEWSLPNEVSSWPRLLRITAYCMIFTDKLRKRISSKDVANNNTALFLASAIR